MCGNPLLFKNHKVFIYFIDHELLAHHLCLCQYFKKTLNIYYSYLMEELIILAKSEEWNFSILKGKHSVMCTKKTVEL